MPGILKMVMNMKTSEEILSSILKTTQMGQVGIRCVMDYAVGADLRRALKSQLKEYDSIESEAHAIASRRGWKVPELNSGIRAMSTMMSRMNMAVGVSDSKIAGMMIQGNTRGMIKTGKNRNHSKSHDKAVNALGRRLLEKEEENIQQMKPFL